MENDGQNGDNVVRIEMLWRNSMRVGCGLVNFSNNSYLNSVLQCLIYCPPLFNYFNYQSLHKCCYEASCLHCAFSKLLADVMYSGRGAVNPFELCHTIPELRLWIRYRKKEDAYACLKVLLCHLRETVQSRRNYYRSRPTNIIDDIFCGFYLIRLKCSHCNCETCFVQPFLEIMLDVCNGDICTALRDFFGSKTETDANLKCCMKSKIKPGVEKFCRIEYNPNVLIIVINRFEDCNGRECKNTSSFSFPEVLDIGQHMTDPCCGPVVYRLYAAIFHKGSTRQCGCYFCYVRTSQNCWFKIEDECVSSATFAECLHNDSYILFYIRLICSQRQRPPKNCKTRPCK